MINIHKTVYDPPSREDGKRILVMRIWPRGVAKSKVDEWLKDLGTEKDLIKQWKEQKISWADFKKAYLKSLKGKTDVLKELAKESKKETLTLLCSCKDEEHCHRYLLKQEIEKYV
jgi:uncharacterized protein YeaO (DUF488 family)